MQSTREWPHSTLCFLPIALVACLLLPPLVDARTFVLKPDGTGDVPTFQAGVDSLVQKFDCPGTDSLVVQPGFYDEEVQLRRLNRIPCDIQADIVAPGGMDHTQLRGFSFDQSPWGYIHNFSVNGLTVLGEVRQGMVQRHFTWRHCRFSGGFTSTFAPGQFGSAVPFEACEFRSFATLQGYGPSKPLEGCRFISAPARLDGTEYGMRVINCDFVGPADTAAFVHTGGDGGVWFENCRFSNLSRAIVPRPDRRIYELLITGCTFSDVQEGAIEGNQPATDEPYRPWDMIRVQHSRFERCGSAILFRSPWSPRIDLLSDTVFSSRGVGIEVEGTTLHVRGLEVRSSGGVGARFLLRPSDSPSTIETSRFSANRGAGLELRPSLTAEVAPVHVSNSLFDQNSGDGFSSLVPAVLSENTSVLNGGNGFVVTITRPPEEPTVFENNIAAGNESSGFRVGGGTPASIRHNDSWSNRGSDDFGVPQDQDDLSVDPQFCDPLADDFHVARSSPCAATGPFGQIGAFDVGCELMRVGLDVQPHSANPINPRSSRLVDAAILGSRLFDPRRVDRATVRLGAAEPALVHGSRASARFEDVNRDGLDDLVMLFDPQGAAVGTPQIELRGVTSDGAPFHGFDTVRVLETPNRWGLADRSSSMLDVPSPQRAGHVTLYAVSSRPERGLLEVFDVLGRRVVARELWFGLEREQFLLDSTNLRAGIYLVRMQTRDFQETRRVALMR